MKTSSDFIYSFLGRLTEKEIKKLKALLEIDEKNKELRLLQIILDNRNTSEIEIIKKSNYTKESYQSIKSDLKKYVQTTGGYQCRVRNQEFLYRLGNAQFILRLGYIEESFRLLEDIERTAIQDGENDTAIASIGYRLWSMVFNGKAKYEDTYSLHERMYKIYDEELLGAKISQQALISYSLLIHDPSLKYYANQQHFQDVKTWLNNFSENISENIFLQFLLFMINNGVNFLEQNFEQCIENIELISQITRYTKAKNNATQETMFIFDLQVLASMHSNTILPSNCYLERFIHLLELYNYSDKPILILKKYMYQCWQEIKMNQLEMAEKYVEEFYKYFEQNEELVYDITRFQTLSKMMLLTLNLSAKSRDRIYSLAAKSSFDFEWNESYNTIFKIFELFYKFDNHILSFKHNKRFNDDSSIHLQAIRTLELFKKKTTKADYEFELILCRCFVEMKPNISSNTLVKKLKKLSNPKLLEKTYVKFYRSYFDFILWSNEIISELN